MGTRIIKKLFYLSSVAEDKLTQNIHKLDKEAPQSSSTMQLFG
jgi:hypothetical protein